MLQGIQVSFVNEILRVRQKFKYSHILTTDSAQKVYGQMISSFLMTCTHIVSELI